MTKEAFFYETLGNGQIVCSLCQRNCEISDGKRGFCGVRENRNGALVTLVYGEVASLAVSPIEKKPFFHFHPGSQWLSLGTLGCNFKCPGCQNWDIAHMVPSTVDEGLIAECNHMKPEEVVQAAHEYDCLGISWTYNEPTVWLEFARETSKLAKSEGFLINFVSNGFVSVEALDFMAPFLDAIRIDIKGFSRGTYRNIAHIDNFQGILEIAERAKKGHRMHVEIITNVVPTLNDDEEELMGIARWIKEKLGRETPWHVTRFHPACDLRDILPTAISVLERTRKMAREIGLHHVYLGNVPHHPFENTFCPHCGKLLIKRNSISLLKNYLKGNHCPFCGGEIAIVL